jgi:hypothetical protein
VFQKLLAKKYLKDTPYSIKKVYYKCIILSPMQMFLHGTLYFLTSYLVG